MLAVAIAAPFRYATYHLLRVRPTTYDFQLAPEVGLSKIRIIVSRVFRSRRQWKGEIRRHLQLQTHSLK